MNEKILIVDDDPHILNMLHTYFSEQGYDADAASGGREAIARIDAGSYDLVITDVRMPEINGDELLRIARQRDPKLQVILITGFPTAETTERCGSLGAAACLMKPIRPDELIDTVERVLANDRVDV